jgi:hypothetical protein
LHCNCKCIVLALYTLVLAKCSLAHAVGMLPTGATHTLNDQVLNRQGAVAAARADPEDGDERLEVNGAAGPIGFREGGTDRQAN